MRLFSVLFLWLSCSGPSLLAQDHEPQDQERHSIVIIGHRGCAGLRPENTMAAFHHALDLGVDAIEFDVHLTKDKKLVVNHDYYLNSNLTRAFDETWIIAEEISVVNTTYQELQNYKLGKIRPNTLYAQNHPCVQNSADESLPTLTDVFNAVRPYPKTQLHIEIKTDPLKPTISSDVNEITLAVLREIQNSGIEDRCAILAFDWRVHQIVRGRNQIIPLYFLDEEDRGVEENKSIVKCVAQQGGTYWSAYYALLTKDNIYEAHKYGLKVNAWTPNTVEDMHRLIVLGVDAITTDRPDILKSMHFSAR